GGGAVLAAVLAHRIADLDEVGDDQLALAVVEHDAVVLVRLAGRLLGVRLQRLGVGLGLLDVALDLAVEGDRVVVVVEQLVDVGVGQTEVVDAEDLGGVGPRLELDLLEVRDHLRVVREDVLLVGRQPLRAVGDHGADLAQRLLHALDLTLDRARGAVRRVVVRAANADHAGPAAQHERDHADQRGREQHGLALAAANAGGGNAVIRRAQVEAARGRLPLGVGIHTGRRPRRRRGRCGTGGLRAGHRSAAWLLLRKSARLLGTATRDGARSLARASRRRCGAVRSLETETCFQIADVLGRGNARFTILIHETPPAWLARTLRQFGTGCGGRRKTRPTRQRRKHGPY